MTIDKAVMAFTGVMVSLSVALAHFVHPAWLLLAAFFGLNLMQASVTGICPAVLAMRRLGVKPRVVFR